MKLSRFDSIEKQRKDETVVEPRPSAGRFDAAPAASTPTEPIAQPVERFDAQSQLSAGDLSELPMLRCAGCMTDNGKFERVCLKCGLLLDTAESVALNQQILSELLATRAEEAARVAARRDEEIRQQAELRAADRAAAVALIHRVADDVHDRLGTPRETRLTRLRGFAAALMLLLAGLITASWSWAFVCWVGALAMTYVTLPAKHRNLAAILRLKR